jgi:transposase
LAFSGATDTTAFQEYVDRVLASELKLGDVVVFDNLKALLAPGVEESIKNAKATVLPLPPYSLDYNPIEELWSSYPIVKRASRQRERAAPSVWAIPSGEG